MFSKQKNLILEFLASGLTLNFAINAQKKLKDLELKLRYGQLQVLMNLYKDGIEQERNERYFNSKKNHMFQKFFSTYSNFAVSEYQRAYANQIRPWSTSDYIV